MKGKRKKKNLHDTMQNCDSQMLRLKLYIRAKVDISSFSKSGGNGTHLRPNYTFWNYARAEGKIITREREGWEVGYKKSIRFEFARWINISSKCISLTVRDIELKKMYL